MCHIRKINSSFLNVVCFIHLQVAFVFPAHPPFFFKESDVLIKYPLYSCEVSPFLFRQCSYPVILRKILMELQVYYSSFSFLLRWIKFKLCCSYHFPRFKCFLMPVHLLIIHFSSFICSGVPKISQKICVSIINPFKIFRGFISFKPFKSTGAISLFNHFNGVSFEWALTHRSFSRILPDYYNFFQSYSQIPCKV